MYKSIFERSIDNLEIIDETTRMAIGKSPFCHSENKYFVVCLKTGQWKDFVTHEGGDFNSFVQSYFCPSCHDVELDLSVSENDENECGSHDKK